jgi:hypothetical protein
MRTSIQQQTDQMLQELESRLQRSHTSAINTLTVKYNQELEAEKDKVFELKKRVHELDTLYGEQTERYSKFEEV